MELTLTDLRDDDKLKSAVIPLFPPSVLHHPSFLDVVLESMNYQMRVDKKAISFKFPCFYLYCFPKIFTIFSPP